MSASNEKDPERAKLSKAVAELDERYCETLNMLIASTEEVSQLVKSAIESGEINVDDYKTAKESGELYKDIRDGLKAQLDAAQLALWNYDLHKAERELDLAKAKVMECRNELLSITTDKTNYVRAANADKTIKRGEKADRISAFDVLLVDARNRSRQAEQLKDQAKTRLEQLKREYNEHAVPLGGDPQKMLTLESYMGHG